MLRTMTITTAALLVLAGIVHAQSEPFTYGPWRSCKIGGGGYIQAVVPSASDPQRYYAYVDVGGMYRSDDGGRRWRMLHGNWPAVPGGYAVRGLLVDPRNADRLIAAVGDQWGESPGIMTSDDGGETWARRLDVPFWGNGDWRWAGLVLARHPQQPDTVFVAPIERGLWRSDDNGVTWRQVGGSVVEKQYPVDLKIDSSDARRMWLCAKAQEGSIDGQDRAWPEALLRSDDGGENWRRLGDSAPSEVVQVPGEPDRLLGLFGAQQVMASPDAGQTWQSFSAGLPADSGESGYTSDTRFDAIAAGPDFVVIASTKGTFYRLDRGQDRWQRIEQASVSDVYEGEQWYHAHGRGWALGHITIDPRDPRRWFWTDWFAIYQTADAGGNWQLSMDGVEVTVLHSLAQDPRDPGVVHLGMADNGYFLSENGGERFYPGLEISNNTKSIALSPALPARLYATGPRTWEWEANQVFVSIDRGHNWTRSPMTGLPDMSRHHCNTIAVDGRDPYVVYLAVSQAIAPGGGGVYRSRDGGRRWEWFGQGLPASPEFFDHDIWVVGPELASDRQGNLVAMSRPTGQVYHRSAGSSEWSASQDRVGGSPCSVAADPHVPQRFYMGVEGRGVLRSDDGGRTWRSVLEKRVRHVAVDAAVPDRIAAGAADGIMISRDGGQTWEMLDQRLPHRYYNLVSFAGDRVIAGSHGSGAFWMPLTEAAARSVKATPAKAEPPPTQDGGDARAAPRFSEDPRDWHLWTASGNLAASRDDVTVRSKPFALRLASVDGRAGGSIAHVIPPNSAPFKLSGVVRSAGEVEECLLAVQVFDSADKQIEWNHVADGKAAADWTAFEKRIELPAAAARCNLVLTLKGDGEAWLDDLKAEPIIDVFLATPRELEVNR